MADQVWFITALEGPWDPVDQMVAEFRRRRDIIVAGLNDIPGIICLEPQGAFYAFPNITETGLTSADVQARLLNDAGVADLSGTDSVRTARVSCGSLTRTRSRTSGLHSRPSERNWASRAVGLAAKGTTEPRT